MRCPKCDANIKDDVARCSFCGQDLAIVHYVKRISNTYYNMGLEKAEVRDLSGAIVILKKSLQFNKRNTNARNLLGLIYYEMGETVAALSEWILSKYLQPEDNAADYYIQTAQKNQTALDATNQTIKKYNAALASAKSGSEDLAIIQLKKVVSMNPRFVRAQQLLALLYISTEEYAKAAKCLHRARRVDFNNTTTLRYMNEVGERTAGNPEKNGSGTVKKPPKKDPLANVTPVGTYQEEKRSLMPIINVIIGIIVGIIICYVLIRPTLMKSSLNEGTQISDTNEKISVKDTQISALEQEKKELQKQVDEQKKNNETAEAEHKAKVKKYDKLMEALQLYYENERVEAALAVSDCKKKDFDSDVAKSMYEMVKVVSDTDIAAFVAEGNSLLNTSPEAASVIFTDVLKLDSDNQEAMYQLAAYNYSQEKIKEAKKYCKKAIEINSGTTWGLKATELLEEIDSAQEQPEE